MPNRFLSDPAISNALLRMGGSILQANSQGAGFGGSLGAGVNAFSTGLSEGRDAQLRQAQMQAEIQKAQREAQFGVRSSGFEGDMARAMVVMNNPNSTDDEKRVAQSIIQTAERMTGAYDPVSGEYRFNQRQRLPLEMQRPATADMMRAPAVQEEPLGALVPPAMAGTTDNTPSTPAAQLLPKPDFMGGQQGVPAPRAAPQEGLGFTPTGNRKVDAELQKVAAEKNMALQAAQLEQQMKGRGESAALFESQLSKLPELENTIKKLDGLSEKASYTYLDRGKNELRKQLGGTPTEGAVARSEYIAVVDNQVLPLLRDTFGAQFTVAEGESLRATLGDPNKTPQEKKAVLNAFIEQKRSNLVSEARRAGIDYTPQKSNKPNRLKFNPVTGELE
jgi:hypothetical protein